MWKDFLIYLLSPDFGLIAHTVPVSRVPASEVGWYPGTGLTMLHPDQRPCWRLGIWAKLYRAVDVLMLSPQGWHCHKYYSNQMLLLGHLKPGRNAGQRWGQGVVL